MPEIYFDDLSAEDRQLAANVLSLATGCNHSSAMAALYDLQRNMFQVVRSSSVRKADHADYNETKD